MKILIASVVAIIVLGVLVSCKSKKAVLDPASAPAIVWGNGGGFTGKEVSFKLLENGQIFKSEGAQSGISLEMKPIKAKVAKAMFSAAKELDLATVALNSPGNMYYFVEFQVDGKPNRITWGDKQAELPQKLKDFYVLLNQLALKGTN
jgi:hypothetical protein